MYDSGMNIAEKREFADHIIQLREARAAERRARRHRRWTAASEFLLSIPAGVAVRLGG